MTRMKWTLAAALVALALPLTANASGLLGGCGAGGCGTGGAGGKWGGKLKNGGCAKSAGKGGGFGLFQPPFQAAPWYLYWPYEAHFQLPAPIGGPFFAPQQLTNPALNPYFGAQVPPGTPPMPPANTTVPPPAPLPPPAK